MLSNNLFVAASTPVNYLLPPDLFRLRRLMPTPSLTLWLCSSCVFALPLCVSASTEQMGSLFWYAGFNIGESRLSLDTSQLAQEMQAQSLPLGEVARNSNDTGYKIYAGATLNDYFAIEGGYFDLGEVDFDTRANGGAISYPLAGHFQSQGINLDLVARMFLTNALALTSRLGVTYNDTDARLDFQAPIDLNAYNTSKHYMKQKFGVGFEYQMSKNFAMRADLERYRMDEMWGDQGDFKLLSMGFVYQYDRQTPYYEPTPAPTPTASQPAEQPYQEPSQPAPMSTVQPLRVELSDVHFAFDQSELTAETKAILAKHVEVLKQQPNSQVQIAGYTSASGTEEYNQQLSERRANAVKQYLITEGGLDSSRLTNLGYGETDPAEVETTPTDLRSSAALANMRVLFLVNVK
jgi:OOP family OmpA-OmpF porin